MNVIFKALLLITLTQLSACAVLSKTDCLNADWRQIGYDVALNGNTNKESAFALREKACIKHGTTANWNEFNLGHSDGSVQYCQLDNAVQLGIKGVTRVIDNQICPERDYRGFNQAFNTGYRLYKLNERIHYASTNISNLNSQLYTYQTDIRHIEKKLSSKGLDKSERKQLHHKRKKLQHYYYEIDQEIEQHHYHLHQSQIAADNYADFIYQDYLLNIDTRFIDPRKEKVRRANP